MAIPNNYIDKIKNKDSGESRDICPAADKVRVDNENFEGTDLDEVLDEVAQAIEEAGSGDGTVTGVKVGSTTYEPTDGVVDISPAIPDTSGFATKTEVTQGLADKVDKVAGYGLSKNDYTDADAAAVATIPSKANDADVVKSISVNGVAQQKNNGNVNIVVPSGGLTEEDISVNTQGDGTVDINVGEDTYTINLNHTHEGMAKLETDDVEDLPDPEDMDENTIYAGVEDGEISVLYIGGIPFYGGGGGASSGPVLRRPADGATIDMGQTTSGTVSKTINVKGKSLTQALTIELDGTGYSFGTTQPSGVTRDSATQLTVTAAAANALNGVDIVVVYTGNDTDENAEGTLGITSASPDSISTEATLVANKVTYEDLAGVKLTGTQWLQTDYYPNANTKIVMTCRFIENSNSDIAGYKGLTFLYCKTYNSTFYRLYNVSANKNDLIHVPQTGTVNLTTNGLSAQDHSVITVDNTTGTLSFAPSGQNPVSVTFTKRTETSPYALEIGRGTHDSSATPDTTLYGKFDLVIYGIEIYDGATKVRNYIPRVRDNVPGLYDTINGNFISSETNNELEAVFLNN